ncbi:hypothetical protein B0H10DRAFT_2220086 [Mycena sp. CBHHK59/15]|nr:hypothetical protein B0H10DRAFT_2220086 [Mycena sp. CBHHK59/15]
MYSLISLLGLVPEQLHRRQTAALPSIGAWYDDDVHGEDEDEEFDDTDELGPSDAEQLQAIIDEQERPDAPMRSARMDREIMSLTCASIAVTVDEHMRVQHFQEMDDELADEILGEEYLTVQEYIKEMAAAKAAARPDTVELVPVHIPDEPSKPFGQGLYASVDVVDFSPLIQQRLQHQTKFAENCTRTKTTRPAPDSKESIRRQLLRKFHEILKEDQARAPGTAVERQVRWSGSVNVGAGNAANAAAAASAVAKTAATRRAKLFKAAKIPHLPLISAGGVNTLSKLAVGDFGIIWMETGLQIAQVEVMYSKGGGKHGKHNNIDEHTNLSGLSYIGAQVYDPFLGSQFRAHTAATARLYTKQFRLLPPFTFLCHLSATPKKTEVGLELASADMALFRDLNKDIKSFDTAVKSSRSRKKVVEEEDEGEDTTVSF